MPSVTAVICAGWAERRENIEAILLDLLTATVTPDQTFILDNTEDPTHPFDVLAGVGVSVLSGRNHECHGKFVAGLFRPADYYVLIDDDTSLGPRTLDCLLGWAKPGFVTGYWGVKLREGSFMRGDIVAPGNVREPVSVDAFHGRVLFMAHDALIRMFEAEGRLRTDGDLTGDDILAGLANPGSVIVPMRGEECFVDLADHGVAMQHRPGYFDDRDTFTKRALEAVSVS